MHDDFQREIEVRPSSDRSFGIVIAGGLAVIGTLPWFIGRAQGVRWWLVLVAGVMLVLALVKPHLLGPLNRAWVKLGLVVARVVSPVALALLYFTVISPLGLIMRGLGRDPLKLRFDRDASTYWVSRVPPGPPPESMTNQF